MLFFLMNLDFYYLMLIIVVRIKNEHLLILDLIVHYYDEFVDIVDHLNDILIEYHQNEISIQINNFYRKKY